MPTSPLLTQKCEITILPVAHDYYTPERYLKFHQVVRCQHRWHALHCETGTSMACHEKRVGPCHAERSEASAASKRVGYAARHGTSGLVSSCEARRSMTMFQRVLVPLDG